MVEVWHFWEFEHFSTNIVRVIDAPSGLELFAVDVFQIVAPVLNDEKVTLINAKANQRFVLINQEIVIVNTMNALAIHSLIGIVKADVIRQFMQWVRSNITPVFKKHINLAIEPRTEYLFSETNFYNQEFLYLKSPEVWQLQRESIELYFVVKFADLLIAQKLDTYNDLIKSHNPDWMMIVKQGLILPTLNSLTNKKASFSHLRYLLLYFQILESNDR
ncbi:hypothetical protein [Nostoc sp. WHI]|uniref:hypothetical protein n=1 Tax=Nostoc sp. WHI TaxID=2650611 RepID=UPI0018C48D80|nr:hypothetical protein [Nostoc sp. WHI]